MSDAPVLIDQRAGSSPLLISIPHAGVGLPSALGERMTPNARALPDTDWHMEKLYGFAPELDVTIIKAELSRYVIDLNRDPEGGSLYPGQNVTELCPLATFNNDPIYKSGEEPDEAEIRERIFYYGQPYHGLLKAEIERIKALHGFCIVYEAHSIRSEVPRFFIGRLPDLNWGTNDGQSCSPKITRLLESYHASSESGFKSVTNGRFKGGFITRKYANPEEGVHCLQLEIAQCSYMNEEPPYSWDAAKAEALQAYLYPLIKELAELKL